MRWASSLSDHPSLDEACARVCAELEGQLGQEPDLLLAFVSPHHVSGFAELPDRLCERFPGARLLGCSAAGVIGGGSEVEQRESFSLVGATLPSVELRVTHLGDDMDGASGAAALDLPDGVHPHFLVLAHPHWQGTEGLLSALDAAHPGSCKLGGLLSGADATPGAALFADAGAYPDGCVVAALWGELEVQSVVAQGCRPVGEAMIVTRCSDHVIYEFNVGKPMDALKGLFAHLGPRDQELCRHSLRLGVEMKAGSHELTQGDFLVREILGVEPDTGAMAVGGSLHNHQAVQFHLRDARTAQQELRQRLLALGRDEGGAAPAAAVLFTCLGRGRSLYGVDNHDSDLLCSVLGPIPIGGFFGTGEIGPVGRRTYVHGYTSVVGLFRAPRASGR